MTEIICAGFGGQGVLVAGMILTYAGMEAGKQVTWFPSYGAEMRGGTANCTVKISEEEIASPYTAAMDALIAMNETSLDKFENKIKKGGLLVMNSSLVSRERQLRQDLKVVRVPANQIAAQMENPKGLNIIMLGALAGASAGTSSELDPDFLKNAVEHYFADKGKHNPKNALCFDQGVGYGTAHIQEEII